MGIVSLDQAGIDKHQGSISEEGKGFSFKGWSFRVSEGPITRDSDYSAIGQAVGGARHLPEQLYGDNSLVIEHLASGLRISFDAVNALKQWHEDDLAPLQLRQAQQWRSSRLASFESHDIPNIAYDWTYTASYSGTFEHQRGEASQQIDASEWEQVEKAMDKSILLQRDPILFFAEIPLYESELDDNGTSQLGIKIRVMPDCWYILQRFFLRVDGHLARMHDVRLLCKFADSPILLEREILHAEKQLGLKHSGVSADLAAFATADDAAIFFQSSAPDGVKLLQTGVLEIKI